MSIAAELIERARDVSVETVVALRGIKLRRAGADWIGPCPIDGGTDRFSINPRKQVFNCRGVGGGDVIALVRHLDGCDFAAAVRALAGDSTSPRRGPAHNLRTTCADLRTTGGDDAASRIEGTYLAVNTCRMAKKLEPPKPIRWKVQDRRQSRLAGRVDAADGEAAIQKASNYAVQRPLVGFACCCAMTRSGHPAAPPSPAMNFRCLV
jgi:hypothetical protein